MNILIFAVVVVLAASPALAQQATRAMCAARPVKPPMSAPIIVERIAEAFSSFLRPTVDGNVLRTDARTVTFALGTQHGLTPGTSVDIVRDGRELRNPRTGEVLGRLEQPVAQVIVQEVFEAYATGRLTDGLADVRAGDRARMRLQRPKIALTVIPLIEDPASAVQEAAFRDLVERLEKLGRFQVSVGGPVTLALLAEGLQREEIFEGNGLSKVAEGFKLEDVVVAQVKSLQGKPYVDVRVFSFGNESRWRGIRSPCVSITGDIAGQARFDAYARGCDGGNAQRCTALGALHEQHSGPSEAWPGQRRRLPLAAEFYRLGCSAGDAVGCRDLASMYRLGMSGHERPESAASLYHRACDLGDGEACASLAEMSEAGIGVVSDAQRTRELYRRACELGLLRVCAP